MRCVQVMATRGDGGLERHFVELCHAIAEQGHDVTAVTDPKYRDRFRAPVRHVSMPMHGPRWLPLRLLRLARLLRRSGACVVHSHATKATAMVRLIAPLLPAGTRHVATIHNRKHNLKPYRGADLVIGVSARVAAMFGDGQARIVHNGRAYEPVEADRDYLCRVAGVDADRPVICTVGRLVPAKGFDLLIEAMVGLEAQLVIAGDGPERQRLADQAKRLNVADRVRLLGHRDDVPRLLAAADLGVVPSRHEGFCYVVAEMLQHGLPVIATDVADVGAFLGPDQVVEPGRADLLHQRLADALANPAALRLQLEPAFAMARQELTLERMAEKTLAVYEEAISSGGR